MTDILEILKYIIPSLIVFFTAYFLIKWFITNDQKKRNFEIISDSQKIITPIRLQAYERVTLFLERISPESLIMRVNQPGMTSKQLHSGLLSHIRAEFEHNLSQQIYMSHQSWEIIKSAKGNITKIINTAADRVKPEDPALELSKTILEMVMELDKSPITMAIECLKKEIQQFY